MGAAPEIANLVSIKPVASLSFLLNKLDKPGIFSPIFKIDLRSIAALRFD